MPLFLLKNPNIYSKFTIWQNFCSFIPYFLLFNMKKLFFITLFVICSTFSIFSQITIKGVVKEESTQEIMSFVNVSLNKNGNPIKGEMTDENGKFSFSSLSTGQYSILITFMGYKTIERKINLTGKIKNVDLGEMFLQEDSQMLKEVEVVAQGSQARFDIDKKVFSVDQSIAAAGGDASEVLQGIPSIEIDTDGEVSLRNSTNVEIWINGKASGLSDENRAQILEQMPAESIESIEVITNPSAKYSPEGSAGIINIVLKKDRKAGYYGSVNAGADHAIRSDKVGAKVGANINFNVGKLDGYANVGFNNDYRGGEGMVNRNYYEMGNLSRSMEQKSWRLNNRMGLTARVGLNYNINEKHTVGVAGYIMSRWQDENRKLTNKNLDENQILQNEYTKLTHGKRSPISGNATIDHTWEIDKFGSSLKSNFTYSRYTDEGLTNYVQDNIGLDQNQTKISNNSTYEFKSDFVKKIKEHQIDAGVNVRYQTRNTEGEVTNNTEGTYITDPSLSDYFDYSEQLYALYASYGARWGNFSMQIGVRGEYTIVNVEGNGVKAKTKSYFQPFPTAFFSYSLPQNNEIQINYTRRINRPRGSRLNPYRDLSDSTNISFGNPDLNPEFVNALELNHIKSWENHTLSTSLYYRYTDNIVQRVQFLDNNNIMNTTYMNVAQQQTAGGEFVLKDSFTKWFNLTTTINLYYERLEETNFKLPNSPQTLHIESENAFSWSAKLMGNFLFTKYFNGQITGGYNSPRLIPQGKTDGFFTLDIGLKHSFLDRKLNLSLTARNVLNTRKMRQETKNTDFHQISEFCPFGPNFRLTLTYSFGNGKKKKSANPSDRSEDRGGDMMMEEEF